MPKIQRSKHEELGEQRRDSIDLLQRSISRGVTSIQSWAANSLRNLNNTPTGSAKKCKALPTLRFQ